MTPRQIISYISKGRRLTGLPKVLWRVRHSVECEKPNCNIHDNDEKNYDASVMYMSLDDYDGCD